VPQSPAGEGGGLGPGPATRGARRPKRARLDPEARRTQLVEVALAQLAVNGDAPFNVDDVADAAGVSRSLVYAYFGDRNGLAAEAYARILDRLDRELALDLPRDAAALRVVVGGCMAFAQANRAAWRMLVSDPARQHPVVVAARRQRAARIAADWGHEPDGDGAGNGAGAEMAAEAALGMLESGVLHWIDNPQIPAEQAGALLATLLWSGLTGRP
jgi:AcrR family transcriptional regulator